MEHEFELEATLPLRINGIMLSEVEAALTICLEDDGCGELSWAVVRIECPNLEGTGVLRWDAKDLSSKDPQDFVSSIGQSLARAAKADEWIDEKAAKEWAEHNAQLREAA